MLIPFSYEDEEEGIIWNGCMKHAISHRIVRRHYGAAGKGAH